MDIGVTIIISVLVAYFLVMIWFQYKNIAETKMRIKKTKQSHNEMYEKMSFEEQELQYNLQGSLLNLPSNIVAMILYKILHWHEK
jgi:hypothetical protein